MSNTNSLDTALPHNPTTGKNYRGGNVEALVEAGEIYPTPEWAGFGQWKKAGRVHITKVRLLSIFWTTRLKSFFGEVLWLLMSIWK